MVSEDPREPRIVSARIERQGGALEGCSGIVIAAPSPDSYKRATHRSQLLVAMGQWVSPKVVCTRQQEGEDSNKLPRKQ